MNNNTNEERLQKALARAGIASRRACEELISAGRVKVNGKIVTQLGTKIDPNKDKILVDDHPVMVRPSAAPRKIYLMLNKPEGYLSTVSDPQGRPTIMELVESDERLYPVGRLDADTSGLLLLTNDGAFANALTHPRFGVEKEYLALLEERPQMRALEQLRKGVAIPVENPQTGEMEDQMTRPAKVELVGYEGSNTLVRFVIKEGKKRQVRLMARAIGSKVLELKRVRFGPIPLGQLPEGQTRALSKLEVKTLLQAANGEPGTAKPKSAGFRRTAGPEASERNRERAPGKAPLRRSAAPAGAKSERERPERKNLPPKTERNQTERKNLPQRAEQGRPAERRNGPNRPERGQNERQGSAPNKSRTAPRRSGR